MRPFSAVTVSVFLGVFLGFLETASSVSGATAAAAAAASAAFGISGALSVDAAAAATATLTTLTTAVSVGIVFVFWFWVFSFCPWVFWEFVGFWFWSLGFCSSLAAAAGGAESSRPPSCPVIWSTSCTAEKRKVQYWYVPSWNFAHGASGWVSRFANATICERVKHRVDWGGRLAAPSS